MFSAGTFVITRDRVQIYMCAWRLASSVSAANVLMPVGMTTANMTAYCEVLLTLSDILLSVCMKFFCI